MSESSFDRSSYTTVNPPHSRKREEFIVRWNLARCPVKCLPGTCLPCPSLANLPWWFNDLLPLCNDFATKDCLVSDGAGKGELSQKKILASSIIPKNKLKNSNFCPRLLGQKFCVPFWKNWKMVHILSPKLFWPTVRKNSSSDWEKLLKFEAEGREFAKNLRSLEQFIQTVKGQNNFW